MKTLIKYSFLELFKTKKFIIFPVVVGIFALLSPITAMYMPKLLKSLTQSEGVIITLPDPTVMDSYIQYFSNLNETVLFVIIFFSISIFIKDKTSGMYPMILSKPISRKSYIISKLITFITLVAISMVIGLLAFSLYTFVLFEEVSIINVFLTSLLQLLFFTFIISIGMFFSVVNKSYLAALLSTFGTYIFIMIISVITVGPFKYLPTTLITTFPTVFSNTQDNKLIWITVIVTLGVISLLTYLATKIFVTQEVK